MKTLWLLLGALAGYVLMMSTSPVRSALRSGGRIVQRYPALWKWLGLFGFAYALFQLGLRTYFHLALPHQEAPLLQWFRTPYQASAAWWHGTETSVWFLPAESARQALLGIGQPVLESVAGLFTNLVSTFPLSALAAVLLWLNWRGYLGTLRRALRRRFPRGHGWILAGVLLCAAAAIIKPLLFFAPRWVDGALWLRWSPVVAWLAFLFEYLLGTAVQVYLLLLAFSWVRGLTFQPERLRLFAIRRFAFAVRLAAVMMLLSTLLLDVLPILRAFFPELLGQREGGVPYGRELLALATLLLASAQITLTLHNESLRQSLRDHFAFVRRAWWPFSWFLLLSAFHFALFHAGQALLLAGLGEGTAPWVLATLLLPWLYGLLGAWLLASWVALFRSLERSRTPESAAVEF